MTDIGPFPNAPTGVWRRIRGGFLLVVGWTFLMVTLMPVVIFSVLTFRYRALSYMHRVSRWCAGTILKIMGVRLRVKGREHIAGRKMRIIALNHTSQLDLFIIASLIPPHGTPLAKKELARVPFVGWAFWAFRSVFIDRSNLDRAKASMAKAAVRLREEQVSVVIAPEGTRSRSGALGEFKMGLFHLANASKAPIVCAVIRGAKECQPMGTIVPHPGIVEVEFHAEKPTDHYTLENLKSQRDALRDWYVKELSA